MKTIKTIRRLITMMVIFFTVAATGCKKDNAFGPNGPGSFDQRIIGAWQTQEILGSGNVTSTSVVEINFNPDGSGFEESFSITPFGQTGRKRSNFTWSAKSRNQLQLSFSDAEVDPTFSITDAGDAMRFTFSNGNRILYTRMN